MTRRPKIALISATTAAIRPAIQGLATALPDAEVWNLLDDRLMIDAQSAGSVTPALEARMRRLIDHALAEGADAVLLTCSIYGQVADAADGRVPVLAPDAAAFDDVLGGGFARIAVVASFAAALADSLHRLGAVADAAGLSPELVGIEAEAAFAPAQQGDDSALIAALTEAISSRLDDIDAVLLAQYSLAPARDRLAAELGIPVFAGPQAAAARLKSRIG